MQIHFGQIRLLVVIAAFSAAASQAQAQTVWVGGNGNNWSTSANWNNGEPALGTNAHLNNGDTIVIDQPDEGAGFADINGLGTFDIRTGATMSTTGSMRIGISGGSNGTLLMNGGTVSIGGGGSDFTVGDSGTSASRAIGSATIGGGTITAPDNMLVGGGGNADGVVLQNGGDLSFGNTLVVGGGGTSTGIYNMNGGSFAANAMVVGNNGSGSYTFNGGTLNIANALTVASGSAATGTLKIEGSGGTINTGTLTAGAGTSSLVFEIEDSSGTTLIDVLGAATLGSSRIDLNLDGYTPAGGETFDLLTGATVSGGVLDPADAGQWSLNIVSGDNGQILQATYVPEPAAIASVLLGAVGLLSRRRK